ncbi:MAG: hypothetical protein NXI32_11160 [bacterium]|nr:hypothetical protein [bacterium]
MHVLVTNPPDFHVPLLFNVDAVVGLHGANATEDVALVQFMIRKAGERVPAAKGNVDRTSRYLAVPLTGVCDAATIDGIRAVQEDMREKSPGTIVDGRVSPARGVNYGSGIWTITLLNGFCRRFCPEFWPRLFDSPDCPGPLVAATKRVL